LIHGQKKCGKDQYRIVKKVVLDTIPQRVEDMVRTIVINCPKPGSAITTQELARITRYPLATVSRLLQDLHVLDIVKREGSSYRHYWQISSYVRECIDKSGLYKSDEELKRPTRMFIKTKKKRK
jgi:predicted HTH transcriptional regulator